MNFNLFPQFSITATHLSRCIIKNTPSRTIASVTERSRSFGKQPVSSPEEPVPSNRGKILNTSSLLTATSSNGCILGSTVRRTLSSVMLAEQQFGIRRVESRTEPSSSNHGEILREVDCPEVLEETKHGFLLGDDDNFEFMKNLRFNCETLAKREDSKVCAKLALKIDFYRFNEHFADRSARCWMKKNLSINEEARRTSNYWLSLMRFTKSDESFALKQELRESGFTDVHLAVVLYKVYNYVIKGNFWYSRRRDFEAGDVIKVLKSAGLRDDDVDCFRALFILDYFDDIYY